jgi:hypothetical protein
MLSAVENYAKYKESPHSWMLGRFIVPIARLSEFGEAWLAIGAPTGWQLSALITKPESELPAVQHFNAIRGSKIKIDALELKATSSAEIASIKNRVPAQTLAYVEIPSAQDPSKLIEAIQTANLRAKIRTGGVIAELFPNTAEIARFLHACAGCPILSEAKGGVLGAAVAFKATAGLHHPVRCVKPFTYEPDSPRGIMHGFLNVFLAAAFARRGRSVDTIERILREERAAEFHFTDDGVRWRDEGLTTANIADIRANFAIAFGSCSFEEPIADLQSLGLLP